MSRSRKICCIQGCPNTGKNNPRLIFYLIPSENINTPRKMERRKRWIRAIQEHMQLKNWKPPPNGRICSAHFKHNDRVNNPKLLSYVPTIFPKIQSKNHQKSNAEAHQKHDHSYNSNYDSGESLSVNIHEVYKESSPFSQGFPIRMESMNLKRDVECQTDFVETSENVTPEVNMICTMTKCGNICHTEIQVNIVIKRWTHQMSNPEILGQKFNNVGTNINPYDCQSGYSNSRIFGIQLIKDNEALINLTSVSFITFNFILKVIPDMEDMELSKPDKLLLTLMGLRKGVNFYSLHFLFRIHENSVYRIFTVMLDHLYNALKCFISWPSKELVKLTLPDIFKIYHPHARIIKEYINISIQAPPGLDYGRITPLQYQNMIAAKFLVGTTPSGLICFVSKCFTGTAQNSFITENSGLLNLLNPSDVVMCAGESSNHCEEILDYMIKLNKRITDFSIFTQISPYLVPYMDHIAFVVCALINVQTFSNLGLIR